MSGPMPKAWVYENERDVTGQKRPGVQAGELINTFDTGATRNNSTALPDYEGFISPLVLRAYGEYMAFHREQADGSLRDSDNWQKGIPLNSYAKSGWRHFIDWWGEHRGYASREGMIFALCGLMFNVMGYLHEYIKARPGCMEKALQAQRAERGKRREAAK